MDGIVFDIQRFSIHDGPGIRSTVFLKGCSLRCLWCHNPESQLSAPQIAVFKHKCVGCGACVKICEIAFLHNCDGCGKCAEVCPVGAREVIGEKKTVEEVFDEVVRDKAYYRTSGGGVTVSGGEPLLQVEFVAALFSECKREGISTAVETAGNVPWEKIETVLPTCDLFLYDVKCMDEEKHRRLTGASNRLILDNAERLKKTGKRILFRMPVVPGYNDDEVEKTAAFCGDFPLEILAYHDTARSKYAAIGREYPINATALSQDEMTRLAKKTGASYKPTGLNA